MRPTKLVVTLFVVCAVSGLVISACSDDPAETDATETDSQVTTDADTDTTTSGRPLLGGRAEAYDYSRSPARVLSTDAIVADLSEVVVIPLDLVGIPWQSFGEEALQPSELPGLWLERVNAMKAAAAELGMPVILAISPITEAADSLAPDAREQSGLLVLNDRWRPACYDPSSDGNPTKWRDAYARFAVWAVQQFEPRWIVLGQRMNRYESNCGEKAYNAVLDYAGEAHRRIQTLADAAVPLPPPTTVVSVDVEDLHGFPSKPGRCAADTPEACFATRMGLLDNVVADTLGLETYPAAALSEDEVFDTGWLTRVIDARPDLPTAVVGTDIPAVEIARNVQFCPPLLESSPAIQSQWADQVLSDAKDAAMAFVIWRTQRDLLDPAAVAPCQCGGDDALLCQHLDQLNAKIDDIKRTTVGGLVAADGTERAAASVWRQTLLSP
ncbi:MAG: hypothetical protein ACI9MR_002614 [Myxococcota bacterium]|jgi:hypothetical protein